MLKYLVVFTFILGAIVGLGKQTYAQQPSKSLPPSFATKIPTGPFCLILINNRHYVIAYGLIDSLIKPSTIKSLKVEKDAAAAIYGYRAGNGIVIIEIDKRYWKTEFPRLEPYLKNYK